MSLVTKENTQDIYPLSPTQKGMLFHTVFDESSPVYFEQFSFTLAGPLDVDAFRKAWDRIIGANPVFRTVFRWSKVKEPLQVVLKDLPVKMQVHDLSASDEKSQNAAIAEFKKKDKARPFNMEEGPLMRLNLFRLDRDRHHFLWSYHHILIDGWCMPIVMKDLVEGYLAAASGAEVPEPVRRPYKDYIAWYLKQDKEAAIAFWKKQLADLEAPTALPSDRPVAQAGAAGAGMVRLLITPETTAALQDLARRERITMSTLVQSVWSILISYYSGQDDVVSGSTVSGRPADLKGSEDMVGLFINTLPVRVRLRADMTVQEVFRQVQEFSVAMRDYEFSLLSDVKACSSIDKTQSLFDSIVVFENYPVESLAVGDGSSFGISSLSTVEMTNFPLTMIVSPGERLTVDMHFFRSMFDETTVRRMMGHLERVLESVVRDPLVKISGIDILTDAEKKTILVDFNATGSPFPAEKCPYQLFEEQARKTPDRTAAVFDDEKLTYRELNERANRLAHHLRKKGVGPESKVGLLVERSLDIIIGILGIQKAGGAYVPMDPDYPRTRIEYMLEDSGSPVVVAQSRTLERLSKIPAGAVVLDADGGEIAKESPENPAPLAGPKNVSHLIYTSGSTGKPKGVMIEHRNVTAFLYWCLEEFTFDEYEELVASTSMCFDLSVFEFLLPLITGAKVIILRSSLDLDEYLEKGSATMINTVPSALKHLLSTMKKRHRIKAINLAGEPLKLELVKEIYDRIDVDIVRNLYGPTEDTTYSTNYRVPRDSSRQPLIGRPISNTRAYILNKSLRPVPVGVKGEIYLTGADLARGYWNAPEKTAERFIPNPFCPELCPVMYKTGDLGSWLPDGTMEFHGRVDYQVKIRGNRIEMGEIEARLAAHEAIRDVVVVDRDDMNGNKYLVAYYVADVELSTTVLRAFIKETLPDYMVPSRFMMMEHLPLTPNGKVDRKALPETDGARPEMASVYTAPRNAIEEALCEVWREVLGVDRVGVMDNFFDLGGDSIVSLQVVGRLKKRGYEIRPKDIFEYQTVAELAAVTKTSLSRKAEQGPVTGEAPLMPIQRWFYELGLSNVNHFNQHVLFRSMIRLDADSLRKSVQAVLEHHDALRARFADGVMRIEAGAGEAVFVEKEVADRGALEAEVNALQGSLDIAKGPVFAAGLYRMRETDYVLFVAHHMVIDGVSWRVLLEDVFMSYGMGLEGKAMELPEKTTSFLDWARRVNEHAKGSWVKEEAAYWERSLAGKLPALAFDHEKGPCDMASVSVERMAIGEEETGYLLRDAHKAFNTSINDLLITGLMRALAHWTRQDEVLFNLEGHGREDLFEGMDVSRTVGWFTTIYPVRLENGRDQDVNRQIKNVKERLRSIPVNGFNYGILRYLAGNGGGGAAVKPQVVFNYLGQINMGELRGTVEMADDIRVMSDDPANILTHPLIINCKVEGACLVIDVVYSKNRFLESSIRTFARGLVLEIENVVHNCMKAEEVEYTPSDFSLTSMSQEQLDSLVEDLEDV